MIMHQFYYQKNMINTFLKSVAAVNPAKLISENLKVENGKLYVSHKEYDIVDKNVYLIGFGKAVLGMAAQSEKILGQHLKSGVICCPQNIQQTFTGNTEFTLKENSVIRVYEGAENNLPDKNAEKGANEIISLVKFLDGTKDHLIVLISGGGSALFVKPRSNISLAEKMKTVKLLMESGADIKELNTVRKKLSLVKGGGLAHLTYPVRTTCLIISDVIGDQIDIIASGPTVFTPDSDSAALGVVQKYNLENKVPGSVLLEIKKISEKLATETVNDDFLHVDNFIIGNNSKALDAGKKHAQESGIKTVILSSQVRGNVENISNFYTNMIFEILNVLSKEEPTIINKDDLFKNCDFDVDSNILEEINNIIKNQSPLKKICIMAGGETTVKVEGNGKGGRNQELALRTSIKIHNLKMNYPHLFSKYEVLFLSAGTDGIDGPTDAAGAVGGSFISEKARKSNLNIHEYLSRNDSYNFYNKLDNGSYLIKTGHTGTNVMDIHIITIFQKTPSEE